MDINYELYRYFYFVAEVKSVSKASEQLGVTQSAISQSIKNLEDQIGYTLFLRTSKGMVLTIEGKALYKSIKIAIKTLEHVPDSIQAKLEEKSQMQELKIGCAEQMYKTFILPKLKTIKEKYPNIKIIIDSFSNTAERVVKLKENELDLIVIKDTKNFSDNIIKTYQISQLEYVFFYNPQFLAFKETMPLLEVAKLPLILKSSGTTTKRKAINMFGVELKPTIECCYDDLVVETARAGLGIGFAPRQYLNQDFTIIKTTESKALNINIYLGTHKESEFVKEILKLLV